MSRTLIPTVTANTSTPFTRQRPCCDWLAKWSSKCSGLVFIVISVNHVSSKSRIVRPGQCLITSPTVKSSKKRPISMAYGLWRMAYGLVNRLAFPPRGDDSGGVDAVDQHAQPGEVRAVEA